MADPSNSSFIPKRGPATKRKRASSSRRVYLFTIVSYILMFATLLATGGVFLYGYFVEKQKDNELAELTKEIESFSDSDMFKVVEFDGRLIQATDRLDHGVSLISIFDALEEATVSTVKISSFEMERENDERYLLTTEFETDSFDSTIFQRDIYSDNETVTEIRVYEVAPSSDDNDRNIRKDTDDENGSAPSLVKFRAELDISLSAIPYIPQEVESDEPLIITDLFNATEEDLEEEEELDSSANNEQDI